MSDKDPAYPLTIDMETVITIHHDILQSTGGISGLSGDKSLDGTLNRIDTRIIYEGLSDPIEIAAWYGYAIARGHNFVDGNKRTALVCMDVYLDLVNINIDLSHPIPEDLATLMEDVAEGRLTQQELVGWLKAHEIK